VVEVQGKLALLEATSGDGVGLYDLTSRLIQYRRQVRKHFILEDVFVLNVPSIVYYWCSETVGEEASDDAARPQEDLQLHYAGQRKSLQGNITLAGLKLERKTKSLTGINKKTNVFELLRAVAPVVGHGEDLSSMFCSELVAATYRVAGILPGKLSNNLI